MGKKRLRKKRVSKGLQVNTYMTRGYDAFQKQLHALDAWLAGKPVMLTIANPDKSETNKPFIRVKAESYFGPHKRKKKDD